MIKMYYTPKQLEIIRQSLIEKFNRSTDEVLNSQIVEMTSEIKEELEGFYIENGSFEELFEGTLKEIDDL